MAELNRTEKHMIDPGFVQEVADHTVQLVETMNYLKDFGVNALRNGAVGDGVTIETATIQGLINTIDSVGHGTLYIPDGYTFLVGSIDVKCNLDGEGTIKLIPGSTFQIPVGYDGVAVNNVEIDGDVQSTGVGYNDYVGSIGLFVKSNDVSIFNVKTRNTFGAGIYGYQAARLTISHADVQACRGQYGDGIYLTGCVDAKVLYAKVRDFTRIGIVSEKSYEVRSKNPTVLGCLVENAHDASKLSGGTELNAGIWFENTLGGKILYNTIKQSNMRGIIVNPLINDGKHYTYLIEGNDITDSEHMIDIDSGSTTNQTLADFILRDNSFYGTYQVGIATGIHCNVDIDTTYFGSSTVNSLILLDMNGYVDKVTINISNCKKGTITYSDPTIKDINMFNKGMIDLTIKDMIGTWSYNMPASQIIGTLKGINTNFIFDSTIVASLCNFLTGGATFTNCELTINTAQQVQINTPSILFNNCKFKSSDATIRQLYFIYKAYDNQFIDCRFDRITINDTTQDASGNFKFLFKDTVFNEYGANGALKTAYYANLTNKWRVLECSFYDSLSSVPITFSRFDVTQMIARNTISPTASCIGAGLSKTSEVNTLVAL